MVNKQLNFADLKKEYNHFLHPIAAVKINGERISDNSLHPVVSDIELELSSGFEASAATITIYNVYDRINEKYFFARMKRLLLLGSSVSIAFGYTGDKGDIFTDMFLGFLSQVRFIGDGENIYHIEVTATDVKGMMMSNCNVRQLSAKSYGEAVEEIFQQAMYQQMQQNGIYQQLSISDTPDKRASEEVPESFTIEMVSESDYEFVVRAAKRFNYEFYVDVGTVYFRKSKETSRECLIELGINQGIKTYDISYDITGLVKEVQVRGMDTSKGKMVSATSKSNNKISVGNRAKSLLNGSMRIVTDGGVTSREQAQYRADSLMEDMAYRFGTLECKCIGIPEIRPGEFIRMTDTDSPCDNRFYVVRTRHTFSSDEGYYTQITAKAAALS